MNTPASGSPLRLVLFHLETTTVPALLENRAGKQSSWPVLETHAFTRVGDIRPTQVDVRIVAATNRSLEQEASQGQFRPDLFYRLSVFAIELPSLHARRDDIPLLAEQFARLSAAKLGKKTMPLSPAFVDALMRYRWKGNIRELKNVIGRAVILNDGPTLQPESLPRVVQSAASLGMSPAFDLATVEKKHIAQILQFTQGNKAETARLLGIGLSTLYRKIEHYQLIASPALLVSAATIIGSC